MGWDVLIPLIIQVGLPLAERIWQKASTGGEVTQADWDELKAIQNQTPLSHLQQVAARLGLPMDDPRVKALADMIPK